MAKGYAWDKPSIQRAHRAIKKINEQPEQNFGEPGLRDGRERLKNGLLLAWFDSAITKGDLGTCTLYSRGYYPEPDQTDKGDETSLSIELTVYARLGNVFAETWGYIDEVDGGWEVVNSECDE